MGKLTIEQRVRKVYKDWAAGKEVDIRKRWKSIEEDLPEESEALLGCIGSIPGATLDDVPREVAVRYSGRDADGTIRLKPRLWERIQAMGLESCYAMDLATVPMVERMQFVGMKIRPGYFENLYGELSGLMEKEVKKLLPWTRDPAFNPNSPKQVADLLFKKLKIVSPKKTPTGQESTNDKVLEALRSAHPALPPIIDYRELGTMRDDFCVKMPRMVGADGRIHCTFRITRVSSGRLSATNPNLLGIPVRTSLGKRIREGFVSEEGKTLGGWDLDQIEMREMAHQSEDPVMIKLFHEGADIHRMTGAMVFGKKAEDVTTEERYASKRIGFGIITGITEVGLAEQMALAGAKGWPEDRCLEVIQEYFRVYRRVRGFLDSCRAEARRYGMVRDRWGRIRYLPGVHSDIKWVREEALRQSHSFKISASAQGVIKMAMAQIWGDIRECWSQGYSMEPLLQIHDELLFELDDDPGLKEAWNYSVVDRLCNTTKMRVPIKAKGSYAPNWAGLKD